MTCLRPFQWREWVAEKEVSLLPFNLSSIPFCYGRLVEENNMSSNYICFVAISRSTTRLQRNRAQKHFTCIKTVSITCAAGVLARTEVDLSSLCFAILLLSPLKSRTQQVNFPAR